MPKGERIFELVSTPKKFTRNGYLIARIGYLNFENSRSVRVISLMRSTKPTPSFPLAIR